MYLSPTNENSNQNFNEQPMSDSKKLSNYYNNDILLKNMNFINQREFEKKEEQNRLAEVDEYYKIRNNDENLFKKICTKVQMNEFNKQLFDKDIYMRKKKIERMTPQKVSLNIEAENNIGKYRKIFQNYSNHVDKNYNMFINYQIKNNPYKRILNNSINNNANNSRLFNNNTNIYNDNKLDLIPHPNRNNIMMKRKENEKIIDDKYKRVYIKLNDEYENKKEEKRHYLNPYEYRNLSENAHKPLNSSTVNILNKDVINHMNNNISNDNVYNINNINNKNNNNYNKVNNSVLSRSMSMPLYPIYDTYHGICRESTDITNNEIFDKCGLGKGEYLDYKNMYKEYENDNKQLMLNSYKKKENEILNRILNEQYQNKAQKSYFENLDLEEKKNDKKSKSDYRDILDKQIKYNIDNKLMNENLSYNDIINHQLDKNKPLDITSKKILCRNGYVEVNPYNKRKYFLGKSNLIDNTILYPRIHYKLNKYMFPDNNTNQNDRYVIDQNYQRNSIRLNRPINPNTLAKNYFNFSSIV